MYLKLAIVIPTYNEAANIRELLPAIRSNLRDYPNLHTAVFVIDDASPDGTAKTAETLGQKLKDREFTVTVIRRQRKEGLGKAYVHAFKEILQQKFDYILQMDADLSHNPKYLPEFLDATKVADFVVGSRYMHGGGTPDWQWYRKLLSYGGNLYVRLLLGSRITDYTSGYNLYSTDLLKKLGVTDLRSDGYEFLIELKSQALTVCKAVQQVPIVFSDRQHGKSKIQPSNYIVKTLLLVPVIAIKGRRQLAK